MRVYAYVDGESHNARSVASWKQWNGATAELSDIERSKAVNGPLLLDQRYQLFWEPWYQHMPPGPFNGRPFDRRAYFSSFSGDADGYHQACVALRAVGFDPRLVHEVKRLADRRANQNLNNRLIEKAKGVDITLAVSILEDAYHNNVDACYLFSSDVDFLPVIRAIRRFGKQVVVFGYSNGLGSRSELEYLPDVFINLDGRMQWHAHELSKVD